MVRAATAHAVSASISTPVRSTVSTFASTSTYWSSMRKFTSTAPTSSGWHNGSRFGVCLAAWIPATRATASTSPFVIAPDAILEEVSGSMKTRQRADARRWLGSLAETSTMRARPSGSRWVNSDATTDKCRCARRSPRPSAADLAHRPSRPHEIDLADAMPGPFRGHRRGDRIGEPIVEVGGVEPPGVAQLAAEIRLVEREQTGPELAFGGETNPVAVVAERLAD